MSDKRMKLFIAETIAFIIAGVCAGVLVFDSVAVGFFLGIFACLTENILFYIVLIEKQLNLLLKQVDGLTDILIEVKK